MNIFNFLSDVIALFLLWLFMQAALHKLHTGNGEYYKKTLEDYGIKNVNMGLGLRYFLGVIELVVALALVFESTRSEATIVAVTLLGSYLLAMTTQLIQGKRDVSCGCSGPNSQIKIGWPLIIRNAVLIAMALICSLPGTHFSTSLWFAVIMASAFLILTYLCVENLIANAQKISILRAH